MRESSELIKRLTAHVLHSISPEEEVLVDMYDPDSKVDGQTSQGPRGLGAEVALGLLLPYVYRFFEKAVDRIAIKAADSAFDALGQWLRSPKPDSNSTLVEIVRKELLQAGLDQSTAALAAPAVLKALVQHRGALSQNK